MMVIVIKTGDVLLLTKTPSFHCSQPKGFKYIYLNEKPFCLQTESQFCKYSSITAIMATFELPTFTMCPLGMRVEGKRGAGTGLSRLGVLGGQWGRRGSCLHWLIALLTKCSIHAISFRRLSPVKKRRQCQHMKMDLHLQNKYSFL